MSSKKIYNSIILFLLPLQLVCQCVPQPPDVSVDISTLGRKLTFTNVSINGGGNFANLAPGAPFTVSFDFSVSTTITACPGCITFFYIGVAGTSAPASPGATTYPNTDCFGSVYAGQTGSAAASFTAPSAPGYYYITTAATWTYWCHQYAVSHNNCYNNAIALIVVGNPPPMTISTDSVFNVSTCGGNDGRIYITPSGGAGCYQYNWSDGSTSQNLANAGSGTYNVTVMDGGCDTVLTFTLTEPGFGFSLQNDTTLCLGDTLILNTGSGIDSVRWNDGSIDSLFFVNIAGTYWVDAWSGLCSDRDSITVSFDNPPVFDLGNDTTLCMGSSLSLYAGYPADSYLWQDGSTDSTYIVTNLGLVWLELHDGACSGSDSITVSFDAPPIFDLGNDTTLCVGDSLLLDATVAGGGVTYIWTDGSTDSVFLVSSAGEIWADVTAGVCKASDTITVTYESYPLFDLITDSTLCERETILLEAGAGNATAYAWQDGSTDSTFLVSSAGNYWVGIQIGVCTLRDSAEISYDVLPVLNLPLNPLFCEGDSLLLDASGAGDFYEWQDGSTNSAFMVKQSGTYWVNVEQGVCSASDTTVVFAGLKPTVNLGADSSVCDNTEPIILDATYPGATYLWQDNSMNAIYEAIETGEYRVSVTNDCGTVSDSVMVSFEDCSCGLWLPKAFSPNGDGKNDFFKAITDCDIGSFDLKIFNRWGEMVYKTQNIKSGWDGTFKSEPLPIESYVWVLSYTKVTSAENLKERGSVTLIR